MTSTKLFIDEAILRFNLDYPYIIHYAKLLVENGEKQEAKVNVMAHAYLFNFYKWKNEEGLFAELTQFDELFEDE